METIENSERKTGKESGKKGTTTTTTTTTSNLEVGRKEKIFWKLEPLLIVLLIFLLELSILICDTVHLLVQYYIATKTLTNWRQNIQVSCFSPKKKNNNNFIKKIFLKFFFGINYLINYWTYFICLPIDFKLVLGVVVLK